MSLLLSKTPIYPEMYGAKGDGSTDDTTAITAALTAAGPGGRVVFARGKSYKTTTQITVPSNYMVLEGYGASITSAADTQYKKFLFSSRSHGTVLGLRFECIWTSATKDIGNGTIEIVNSTDITVKDCEFNEIAQSGVYVYGTSARINIDGNQFYKNYCSIFVDDDATNNPTYIKISNNIMRTTIGTGGDIYSGAIKISGVGTVNSYCGHVITGNQMTSCGQMGVEFQGWINGCVISSNTIYDATFGISIDGCSGIVLADNFIRGCSSFGIELTSGGTASSSISVSGGSIIGTNIAGTIVCNYGLYVGTVVGATITGVHVTQCISNEICVVGATDVTVNACNSIGKGYLIKNSSRVVVSTCSLRAGTSANYFWFIDSTNSAVSKVTFIGCVLNGSVANNGILLYSPGNSITDLTITKCITTGAFATGWMYATSVSGAGSVSRIWLEDNIGDSSSDFEINFNAVTKTVAVDTTLDARYSTLIVDATSGAKAITLPTAVGIRGKVYNIQKYDAFNNVTVGTTSSQTINGSTTNVLTAQYKRVTVQSDGANWIILQSN